MSTIDCLCTNETLSIFFSRFVSCFCHALFSTDSAANLQPPPAQCPISSQVAPLNRMDILTLGSLMGIALWATSVLQNRCCWWCCTQLMMVLISRITFGRRMYPHRSDTLFCERISIPRIFINTTTTTTSLLLLLLIYYRWRKLSRRDTKRQINRTALQNEFRSHHGSLIG